MDKIRRFQKNGIDDAFLNQFILKYEHLIDWQKAHASSDVMEQIKKLVKELIARTRRNSPNNFYMKDIDLKEEFEAHANDPQVQQAWAIYQSNPEGAKRKILDVVNSAKEKVFKKWVEYMTKDNPIYAAHPAFLYTILKPIFEISNENQKATCPGVNAEALAAIFQKIKDTKGLVQFGIAKAYKEAATAALTGSSVTSGAKDGWVHIPGEGGDEKNFQANVDKLQTLSSGTGWCTASGLAEPYLKQGDFYILIKDGKAVAAIRLFGPEEIKEIRGKNNSNPAQYLPEIKQAIQEYGLSDDSNWVRRSEAEAEQIARFKNDYNFRNVIIANFIRKKGVPPMDPAKEFGMHSIPLDVLEQMKPQLTQSFAERLPEPNDAMNTAVKFITPYLVEGSDISHKYYDFIVDRLEKHLLSDSAYIWGDWTHLAQPDFFNSPYFISQLEPVLNKVAESYISLMRDKEFKSNFRLSGNLSTFIKLLHNTTQIDTAPIRRRVFEAMLENNVSPRSLDEADIAEIEALPHGKEKMLAHYSTQEPESLLGGFSHGKGKLYGAQVLADTGFKDSIKAAIIAHPQNAREALEHYGDLAKDPEVEKTVKASYDSALDDLLNKGRHSSISRNMFYIPYIRSEPVLQKKMLQYMFNEITIDPYNDWKYNLNVVRDYQLPITQEQLSKFYYDTLVNRINSLQDGKGVARFISDLFSKSAIPVGNFMKMVEIKTMLKNKLVQLLQSGQLVEIGQVRRLLREKDFPTAEYNALIANQRANPQELGAAKEKAKQVLTMYVFGRKKRIMQDSILNKPNPAQALMAHIRRHYGLPVSILARDPAFMRWINAVILSHKNQQRIVLTESFREFYKAALH